MLWEKSRPHQIWMSYTRRRGFVIYKSPHEIWMSYTRVVHIWYEFHIHEGGALSYTRVVHMRYECHIHIHTTCITSCHDVRIIHIKCELICRKKETCKEGDLRYRRDVIYSYLRSMYHVTHVMTWPPPTCDMRCLCHTLQWVMSYFIMCHTLQWVMSHYSTRPPTPKVRNAQSHVTHVMSIHSVLISPQMSRTKSRRTQSFHISFECVTVSHMTYESMSRTKSRHRCHERSHDVHRAFTFRLNALR